MHILSLSLTHTHLHCHIGSYLRYTHIHSLVVLLFPLAMLTLKTTFAVIAVDKEIPLQISVDNEPIDQKIRLLFASPGRCTLSKHSETVEESQNLFQGVRLARFFLETTTPRLLLRCTSEKKKEDDENAAAK